MAGKDPARCTIVAEFLKLISIFSGSGLGVAISDRLARLFKSGKLKISSEANKGSSFTFSGLFREADAASPHQVYYLNELNLDDELILD